jgi:hypothetical protein
LGWKLETTAGRGRPRRRWIEGVTDILRLHNITAYKATENTLSRKPIIDRDLQCGNGEMEEP